MLIKTQAIVLRSRELSNADRVYEVLTPREGKLSLIARSASKPLSKMSGHMMMLAHVRLMIGRGRQDHLAGVASIRSYRELRSSLSGFILSSSLVELLLSVHVPGQAVGAEYDLLISTLDAMSEASRSDAERVAAARIFMWKLLTLGGWGPDVVRCGMCGQKLSGGATYIAREGFVCRSHNREGLMLDDRVLSHLEGILAESDMHAALHNAGTSDMRKDWSRLSRAYYQDIVSKPLQSLRFFALNA